MTLADVIRTDLVPTDAVTVEIGDTAQGAGKALSGTSLGAVVVVDGEEPVGIVTDRDLATRVVGEGRDPQAVSIEDVMSTPLTTVKQGANVLDVMDKMADERIRRLPVVDDGNLEGMITVDNVLILLSSQLFSGVLMAQTNVG